MFFCLLQSLPLWSQGIADELRREVWAFLLGYYSFDSTYKEREAQRKTLKSVPCRHTSVRASGVFN